MVNPVINAIMERRSVRAYADKPLTKEQTETLVNAALAAPSGMNAQPWHVTVLTDKALMKEIESGVAAYFDEKGDADTANRMRGGGLFYDAPTVFCIATPGDNPSPMDTGIMVENIAIAAKGMGLGSVILGLPRLAFTPANDESLCARLKYPKGWSNSIMIAVGVEADSGAPHALPEGKVAYVG